MATTVHLKNIRKIFSGKKEVIGVDNVDLTLQGGKLITLLGPSGCGKTTTLRIIAGLEKQTSGDIYFDDTNVNDISTRDREVAMVFQSYALYPHMTVRKNLSYGLKMRKTPENEIETKVHDISAMLGLQELLGRKPRELSGGQQQRVALGRAIVRDPKVFLLDEPLSNLDAKLRAKMRTEIQTLQKKLGQTMIYVTHDQLEAMSMSDEIILMNNGKVMQTGSPLEIFENPKNMFVASFIGTPSINFLPATLKEEKGKLRAYVGSWPIGLSDARSEIVRGKKLEDLVLGIRPEYIFIRETGNIETPCAQIKVIEPVGSEMIVHVVCENNEVVVRCGANPNLIVGQRVWLDPSGEKILLFDPRSDQSL
jgi:multiple sugar transport system ATP-binding protein